MLHHALTFLVLFFLLLILLDDLWRFFSATAAAPPSKQHSQPKEAHPLRPRSPDECPACYTKLPPSTPSSPTAPPVPPWRAGKIRRGTPKRVNTEGFTCPNPDCLYHNDTAAQHHALVGDRHHGQTNPFQDLRCQACRHKFTVRRNTPLFDLKTAAVRVALVLTARAEGLSVSGAVHTFDHGERTITT